ncbi:protein phytochrome kinase substrate 1-like [Trifolium pratense]|uniref:Protein phytochrome kinase substrate 1-like n=1 Tax=Trifolium pratense TaxID=57577 RepID=A0A2K3M860_TRIPR|nr:protein phytochrome kinase substrate 1-like [Trifolium pratense]
MRLKKPSWEASTKLVEQETEFSTNCDESNYDDDAGSDASSDLFEIESLTGNKTNSFFTRTSTTSHVASGCNSPTCYAPSEASIEWSVITASAVEYSAISDHEDQGSVITIRSPIRTSINSSSNGKHKVNKEISMPKRRPSKFLGCNSQKSVGVAVDAFTTTYEKQSSNQKIVGKSEMLPQMTKFKVESFGARNEQHGYGKPPLRRSHEPHGAQLLYI